MVYIRRMVQTRGIRGVSMELKRWRIHELRKLLFFDLLRGFTGRVEHVEVPLF